MPDTTGTVLLTIPDQWRAAPPTLALAPDLTIDRPAVDMLPPARPDGTGEHWLLFDRLTRVVTGCHCGFRADLDADDGWGDSVVKHLLEEGGRDAIAALIRPRGRVEEPPPPREPVAPRTTSPDGLWDRR